jgi:hypothetical protein
MLKQSSYTESVGRELLTVTGQLGICVGWLAFDCGKFGLARNLYGDAQVMADNAANPVLTVHVLQNRSMLASYLARITNSVSERTKLAHEGWQLASQAAEEGRYEPFPKLHALTALRHARAASLLGNAAAFATAIARAHRELDRGPRIDEPEWIRFMDETEITGHEAMGRTSLGEPAKGEELCRTVLDGQLSRRNRALYDVELAVSLLEQNAGREALAAGTAALDAIEDGVASARTLDKLRPVRLAAAKASDDEFCTRFDLAGRSLGREWGV